MKTFKNKLFKLFANFDFEIAGELVKDFGLGMLVNSMYSIGHGALTKLEVLVTIISMFIIAIGLKIKKWSRL